jgi:hypothetical protein
MEHSLLSPELEGDSLGDNMIDSLVNNQRALQRSQ